MILMSAPQLQEIVQFREDVAYKAASPDVDKEILLTEIHAFIKSHSYILFAVLNERLNLLQLEKEIFNSLAKEKVSNINSKLLQQSDAIPLLMEIELFVIRYQYLFSVHTNLADEIKNCYQRLSERLNKRLYQVSLKIFNDLTHPDITENAKKPNNHHICSYYMTNLMWYVIADVLMVDVKLNDNTLQLLRMLKLERWINQLVQSFNRGDYQTATAIMLGLNHRSLVALKTIWSMLSPESMQIKKQIFIYLNNYKDTLFNYATKPIVPTFDYYRQYFILTNEYIDKLTREKKEYQKQNCLNKVSIISNCLKQYEVNMTAKKNKFNILQKAVAEKAKKTKKNSFYKKLVAAPKCQENELDNFSYQYALHIDNHKMQAKYNRLDILSAWIWNKHQIKINQFVKSVLTQTELTNQLMYLNVEIYELLSSLKKYGDNQPKTITGFFRRIKINEIQQELALLREHVSTSADRGMFADMKSACQYIDEQIQNILNNTHTHYHQIKSLIKMDTTLIFFLKEIKQKMEKIFKLNEKITLLRQFQTTYQHDIAHDEIKKKVTTKASAADISSSPDSFSMISLFSSSKEIKRKELTSPLMTTSSQHFFSSKGSYSNSFRAAKERLYHSLPKNLF